MALEVKEGGAPGDFIKTKEALFFNRTGATVVKGDVCVVDLRAGSTEASAFATWVADTTPTEAENPLATAVKADATAGTNPETAICIVAQESIADDAVGRFAISGVVQVNTGTSTAVAINAAVRATSASHSLSAAAASFRTIGHALEAGATGSTATTSWVIFDGLNGLGPY